MRVAPKYIGKCSGNPKPSWVDNALSFRMRLQNLNSPKGLPPKEWIIFCKRHAGWRWPIKVIKLYLRVLFPGAWDRLREILK